MRSSNFAFDGRAATVLCSYDADALDEDVLADARTTHALLSEAGSTDRSADYAPQQALARYNQPLPTSTAAVTYTVATTRDLGPARSAATQYAQRVGLSTDGLADLRLIVTELATNSLHHGGGSCRLALWQHEGHIVCEASDKGRLDDPLAGRRPPPHGASGRGLFLVNTVADLVRIHTTGSGTTIQAYLRLSRPAGSGDHRRIAEFSWVQESESMSIRSPGLMVVAAA